VSDDANSDDDDGSDGNVDPHVTKPSTKSKKKSRRKPKNREVLDAQYQAVEEYFERNWFIEPWIGMCLSLCLLPAADRIADTFSDIGMPENQTRDGSWNTNNWAETAFKTFDTVFLDNRMNKR
jgi:hypothetical protein